MLLSLHLVRMTAIHSEAINVSESLARFNDPTFVVHMNSLLTGEAAFSDAEPTAGLEVYHDRCEDVEELWAEDAAEKEVGDESQSSTCNEC